MVKIRLQRHGRKKRAFYYIVAADQRAPRDGRYIERIGSYNPNTNPATIDLDLDASVRWLQNGAVPSDTCRAILSYKGALYKNHLLKGVTKNAFTEEEANQKFENWLEQKAGRIDAKKDHLAKTAAELQAEAFKQEEAKRLAREKAIAEKNAPPAEIATEEEPVAETELSEETSEAAPVAERNEAVAEPETAEEPAAEVTEEPVAEVTEEPAAEVTEETVAEVTEEPTAEVSEEPASEQKDETADASEEKPEESAEESTEEK